MKYIAVFVGIFLFGVIVYLFSFSWDEKLEVVEPGEVSMSISQSGESLASKKGESCFESKNCNVGKDLQKQTKGLEIGPVQEGKPIRVKVTGPEPSAIQVNILEVDEYTGSSVEARAVENGAFELHGEGEKHIEIVAAWRMEDQQNRAQAVISRVMKVDVVE